MALGPVGEPITSINVTSLVDVMMMLLIVFMVTAPMIDPKTPDSLRKVEVDLPATDSREVDFSEEEKLVLVIDRDSKVIIGEELITDCGDGRAQTECLDELDRKLGNNHKLKQDREIYLMADKALSYGLVVDVMARLRNAGVETLGMVTNPPDETPTAPGSNKGKKQAAKKGS